VKGGGRNIKMGGKEEGEEQSSACKTATGDKIAAIIFL